METRVSELPSSLEQEEVGQAKDQDQDKDLDQDLDLDLDLEPHPDRVASLL